MSGPGGALEVRDAVPGDVAALVPLFAELGFPAEAGVIERRLAAFARAGESALVAVREGEVVGLLTLHVTPVLHRPAPVGRLTALVVASSRRGRGVGRALVAEAERRLDASGCGMVEVTSNLKRTDAHAFYERLGYSRSSYRFFRDLGRG